MNDSAPDPQTLPAHGSSGGHEAGCLTARMCPNDGSTGWLTCAEAAIRRRGDYRWFSYPRHLAMPRSDTEAAFLAALTTSNKRSYVHGTIWGYARGCRDGAGCPNAARKSCFEARREYVVDWRQARRQGVGRPIEHGTTRGYGSGCRGDASCPGGEGGVTCLQAQRAYKLERARTRGVHEVQLADNVQEAAAHVRRLLSGGVSIRELARLSGVGRTTLGELARYGSGGRAAFTSSTAERVLSLRAPAASVGAHSELP